MRTLTLIGLVGVGLLAGCGSDDSNDSSGGSSKDDIPVQLSDYAINPSTLSPRQPGKITLSIINQGPSSHALEIEGNGVEEETETLGTGAHADLTVDLKPGTYEMYCPIDGHRARGMEGTIVVRDTSGSGGGTTTSDDDSTTTDSSGYGSG
jgi:plastocyanin